MNERYYIGQASLDALFEGIVRGGARVVAPKAVGGAIAIDSLRSPSEMAKDCLQAVTSAKSIVFPKVEKVLGYRYEGKEVTMVDPNPDLPPTVVFGLRPCEARAFAALDAVFNWDQRDKFYNSRFAKLTVVTVACTRADDACFCTSLGSSPDDTRGSDVLLRPVSTAGGASAGFAAETLTPRGDALVASCPSAFTPLPSDAQVLPLAEVPAAFDLATLRERLANKFDDLVWTDQSLRCLGCGACAYVCPTCACFDLQDESDRTEGRRLRLWDSCGFRLFTLHASGHNPRDQQAQRWRQRVYHKFSYYPERFELAGCVGCGKCTRACPVDMNLKEHLTEVAREA